MAGVVKTFVSSSDACEKRSMANNAKPSSSKSEKCHVLFMPNEKSEVLLPVICTSTYSLLLHSPSSTRSETYDFVADVCSPNNSLAD